MRLHRSPFVTTRAICLMSSAGEIDYRHPALCVHENRASSARPWRKYICVVTYTYISFRPYTKCMWIAHTPVITNSLKKDIAVIYLQADPVDTHASLTSVIFCVQVVQMTSKGPWVTIDLAGVLQLASYHIRKIYGCACAGNVFPTTDFKGNC